MSPPAEQSPSSGRTPSRIRRKPTTTMQLLLALALAGAAVDIAGAASDGWTPIIPEGVPGSSSASSSSSGRHALAVEPGLPGSLASSISSLASSLGSSSYHSHVDHVLSHGHAAFRPPPPSSRPSSLHAPSPHPSALPDYPLLQHPGSDHGDTCSLYKTAMTQDLYFQYIQYKVHMPDLKEFTLCMWHKFYNHSSDHPLFSYAIRDTPRAILSWVSATDRSTYFSMSVDGHTLFRLNYPLRLNRWYHSCQSWNGRTGEWQVWVNAERVGRGFHNLLVNHVIKGGGVAITGQEQRQYGGGFLEGEGAPKGAGGMLGEITQLQMYTVALTAGKAYRDHKHHHGNYAGDPAQPQRTTTTTPAPMPDTSTVNPYAPFITNGQLTPQLPIFELSAFRKNIPMPPMEDAQASNAQASSVPTAGAMLDLSQLLGSGGGGLSAVGLGGLSPAVSYLHMSPAAGGGAVRIPLLSHSRPALDLDPQQHYLFKRDDTAKGADQPDAAAAEAGDDKQQDKRDTAKADAEAEPAAKVKRAAEAAPAEAADDAAAEKAAAEVESQRLPGKPAKRESRRVKAKATAAPEPASATDDVKPSTPTKRETEPQQPDEEPTETKKKRQTISLHSGAVDLGGDIDTSLLTQGLSGLLPHGELLGAGAPGNTRGPLTYVEFHGNNHHQLLSLPQLSGKLPMQMQLQMQGAPPPPQQPQGPPPPPLKRENEPAEGEVMAVMSMCSGCAPDPFAKVNIISWQGTPKKLYSGVLYLPAKPVCRKF